MNNYPNDLDDEALERLTEFSPETANDLKLWKRCNEIGKMFDFATKLGREEYEKMTLEELKKYKNGICLGYSTIGYLLKNVFPFNSIEPNDVRYVQLRSFKDFDDSKVYPLLMYFKNESREGILCRPMIYKNNLLSPIGLLHTNGVEPMAYIAKTEFLPIETDIDSIYEYKRKPIILNR